MKKDKRRIVIDTNIYISFFLKTNSIPAQAVKAVVTAHVEHARQLLSDHPELVRDRSSSEHRSTLLHYVASNGIELDHTRDRFGVPRVKLEWSKSEFDIKTARMATLRLGRSLAESGTGRL